MVSEDGSRVTYLLHADKMSEQNSTAIDPEVLRFLLALLIATAVVALIERFSEAGAYTLTGIVVLGLLLNNPIILGFITLSSQSLQSGLSGE